MEARNDLNLAKKKELSVSELVARITELQHLKDKVDEAEAVLSSHKKIYLQEEKELIEIFEELGLKTLKIPDGRSVTLMEPALKASLKADKKDEAIQWFKNNGFAHIIFEMINSHNLNRTIKERLEAGDSVPDDLVEYVFIKKLQFRK